ncbi:RimK/LysX family protein [Phaeobacter sp. JH20_36]|uniref:ATP-dependent zinc protease family protein n=1 Tax=Phaeobacter TaxID=302485 RepID=UPI0030C9631B
MLVVGWQERVDLPLLGLTNLKAKIDTGARTSALHATDIVTFERDGVPWVRFHTRFDDDSHDTDVESPIHDQREIKNTSGIPETRIVIRTRFRISDRLWKIDLSLTERTEMKFRMIVGRTALRGHSILVNPAKRNLTAPKPAAAIVGRRKNS